MADTKSEREFFRIEYPISDRPHAVLNGKHGKLVNMSEQGVKWESDDGNTPIADGDRVFGRITFSDGVLLDFSGKAIRSREGQVAVQLTSPIPLARIMSEQRELIKRFGALKQ